MRSRCDEMRFQQNLIDMTTLLVGLIGPEVDEVDDILHDFSLMRAAFEYYGMPKRVRIHADLIADRIAHIIGYVVEGDPFTRPSVTEEPPLALAS